MDVNEKVLEKIIENKIEEFFQKKNGWVDKKKSDKIEKEYEKGVEYVAKEKDGFIFENDHIEHAGIVLTNLIKYSEKEVIIYDENLSGDIAFQYYKFIPTLKDQIKSKKKIIKFILKQKDSQKNSFIQDIQDLKEDKEYSKYIEIKIATDTLNEEIRKLFTCGYECNFAIGDTNKFRIEYEKDERKAMCSFNNEKYPKKFIATVTQEFDKCLNYF